MRVYTAQYKYEGPDRLDITVANATDYYGKMFAPDWDLVNGYKNGSVSEESYSHYFRNMMNERYRYNSAYMTQYAQRDETVTLVCFCPAGAFCHRVIVAEGLEKMGAVYHGERNIRHENENSYINGDLLSIGRGVIVQQVNCQGVMGAGLAKAIADHYPEVKERYLELCKPGAKLLGETLMVQLQPNFYVANLFAQNDYGREKRRYTNYGALRRSLNKLRKWLDAHNELFKNNPLPIYFPYRMSCGLAGGNWYLVYKMIRNIFPEAEFIRKG